MDPLEQRLQNIEDTQKKIERLLLCSKLVLSFSELVEYTGMGRQYLYKLSMNGLIPGASKPTGRRLFFDRRKIDYWLLSIGNSERKENNKK